MKPLEQILREYYLDYFNNYLSVEKFAEHNGLTKDQAEILIKMGTVLHEQYVKIIKGETP